MIGIWIIFVSLQHQTKKYRMDMIKSRPINLLFKFRKYGGNRQTNGLKGQQIPAQGVALGYLFVGLSGRSQIMLFHFRNLNY